MSRLARINILLAVGCAGAGYAVVDAATAPRAALPPVAVTTDAPAPREVRFMPPAVATLDAISDRPLFDPARRPVPRVQPAAAHLAPPPRIRIAGLIGARRGSRAMLEVGDQNAALFSEGDDVSGWRLDRIAADRIVLVQGTRRHVIVMGEETEAVTGDTNAEGAAPRQRQAPAQSPITDMSEMIDQ